MATTDELVVAFKKAGERADELTDLREIEYAKRREVVCQLIERGGMSYRDVGKLLGISTPRVGQLAKGTRAVP